MYGLALALPTKVALARPTVVGRALTTLVWSHGSTEEGVAVGGAFDSDTASARCRLRTRAARVLASWRS